MGVTSETRAFEFCMVEGAAPEARAAELNTGKRCQTSALALTRKSSDTVTHIITREDWTKRKVTELEFWCVGEAGLPGQWLLWKNGSQLRYACWRRSDWHCSPVQATQMGILMNYWWLNEDEGRDEKLPGCNIRDVPGSFLPGSRFIIVVWLNGRVVKTPPEYVYL